MILKFSQALSHILLKNQSAFVGDLLFKNFRDCPSCANRVWHNDSSATVQRKGIISFINQMCKLVVNVSRVTLAVFLGMS